MKVYSYYGYIYRTDILDKNAYYIGQATCKKHGEFPGNPIYYGSGARIKAYIKKYGTKNLKVSLLAIAHSQAELNRLESEMIGGQFSSKNCWNLIAGGQSRGTYGLTHSQLTKIKISESVSKYHKENPMSIEIKNKISNSNKGKRSNLGYHHSDETKKKLSEINTGKKQSPETIAKRIEKLKGKKRLDLIGKPSPMLGKNHSPETIEKLRIKAKSDQRVIDGARRGAEASKGNTVTKGRKWYNNGKVRVMAYECPPGFVEGLKFNKD